MKRLNNKEKDLIEAIRNYLDRLVKELLDFVRVEEN